MKDVNERFIMVPIALLEIPEFVRHFDSKPIGSIYRVLSSKVWRQPREGLRKNSSNRIKLLTGLFEMGFLASIHDLSSLSEAVGYDDRSVRRALSTLIDLKLISAEKIDGEVFYIVGETSLSGKDGYNLGINTESFYINRWRDFVNFCNQYAPDKIDIFRKELVSFFQDGQICQKLLTNLSQISDLNSFRNLVLDEDFNENPSSLIDKGIEYTYTSISPDEKSSEKNMDLRSLSALSPSQAVEQARSLYVSEQFTLKEINAALSVHVASSQSHYLHLPRFAMRIQSIKNEDVGMKDQKKLVSLWLSIQEDVTGSQISSTQGAYSKINSVVKNLLKKYSYNQLYWTICKVAAESLEDTEFLSKNISTLDFFARKHGGRYNEVREEALRRKKIGANIDRKFVEDEDKYMETSDIAVTETTGNLLRLSGWLNE